MSGRVTSSGKHACRLLEQDAAQLRLGGAESLRNTGQIPDRIDRDLHDRQAAVLMDVDAVGFQTPGADRIAHLDKIEPRPRHRDGRADVLAFRDLGLERIGDEMAPRIEGDDAPRLRPLRERTDGRGRMRIREVGPADRIEGAGGNCKRTVEGIRAAVSADDVTMLRP